jgi:hypothetical protein
MNDTADDARRSGKPLPPLVRASYGEIHELAPCVAAESVLRTQCFKETVLRKTHEHMLFECGADTRSCMMTPK